VQIIDPKAPQGAFLLESPIDAYLEKGTFPVIDESSRAAPFSVDSCMDSGIILTEVDSAL
jgi:hypothetical protein